METNQKSVTIGGSFIIKESNPNDIFTPEDFTEEHKMMKESVIEFVDREIVPKKQRFEKKDYQLTEEIMSKIGELGFLAEDTIEEMFNRLNQIINGDFLVNNRMVLKATLSKNDSEKTFFALNFS